jgi:hypothetical protein
MGETATNGTGIEKELFPSTATTVGMPDSFFDFSYYYTATMKRKTVRYVLFGGLG